MKKLVSHILLVCWLWAVATPAIAQDVQTERDLQVDLFIARLVAAGWQKDAVFLATATAKLYCELVVGGQVKQTVFVSYVFEYGTDKLGLPTGQVMEIVPLSIRYARDYICP